jgi:hypothetical protein
MLDRILNPTPTFYKWDKFGVGFFPALLLPLLAFVFFYLLQIQQMSFEVYLQTVKTPSMLSKILSFGCIINLAVFFIFISRDYYNAARGVIAATVLYGIPVVIAKFIV